MPDDQIDTSDIPEIPPEAWKDVKAAKVYAALRSERSLKAPDAIPARAASVDLFVTNGDRLQGKHVDGIQFIVPLARAPI